MDANIRVYVSLAGLEFAGCDVVVGFRAVNVYLTLESFIYT